MDVQITSVVPGKFEVQKDLLNYLPDRRKDLEEGEQQNSTDYEEEFEEIILEARRKISRFEHGQLIIITHIALTGELYNKKQVIAEMDYGTIFEFCNPSLLTGTITNQAVQTMIRCIDIAQSQLYAVFSMLCSPYRLRIPEMSFSPYEDYEDEIYEFLNVKPVYEHDTQ